MKLPLSTTRVTTPPTHTTHDRGPTHRLRPQQPTKDSAPAQTLSRLHRGIWLRFSNLRLYSAPSLHTTFPRARHGLYLPRNLTFICQHHHDIHRFLSPNRQALHPVDQAAVRIAQEPSSATTLGFCRPLAIQQELRPRRYLKDCMSE